jgi:hypothetical protein
MSDHPMFQRINRRMEVLQREIDKTPKAGVEAQARSAQNRPAAAPRGILTQGDGNPKPQEFCCT